MSSVQHCSKESDEKGCRQISSNLSRFSFGVTKKIGYASTFGFLALLADAFFFVLLAFRL
jgi:hypothetical protein